MGKWVKKNWIWLIVVVLAVIGVPIIINELYKTGKGYSTLWSAADVLSYYGMIIAAFIGIAGVYITVYISNKNYRDDARNRIIPYIALNAINNNFNSFMAGFEEDEKNEDNSFIPDDGDEQDYMIFAIDKKGKIRVNDITDEERKIVNEHPTKWKRGKDGAIYMRDTSIVSIPFIIENVGNGTATNLHMGFALSNNRPYFVGNITLNRNNQIHIYIFSAKEFNEIKGNYSFDIFYDDISGNHYVQQFAVKIFEDEKGRKYNNISTNGKQFLLKNGSTDTYI